MCGDFTTVTRSFRPRPSDGKDKDTMAYNKLRREIMTALALEENVPADLDKLALALEMRMTDLDDSAMKNDPTWQAFKASALNNRILLIQSLRLLRKTLITALGGPVVDARPLNGVAVPDCQTCGMEATNPQHSVACPDDAGAHDYVPVVADSLPSVSEETSAVQEETGSCCLEEDRRGPAGSCVSCGDGL